MIEPAVGQDLDFATLQAIRLKVVEASPDAKIVIDDSGIIVDMNEEAEMLFGWHRNDAMRRPIEMLIPTSLREGHKDHIRKYFRTPRRRSMGQNLTLVGLKRGGEEFSVEVRLAPIVVEGENGGIFALAVIRRDDLG